MTRRPYKSRLRIVEKASILDCTASVVVNPVNTVGVMGAGLALAFSKRYPGLLADYRIACTSGILTPDQPFYWPIPKAGRGILCVATKEHWQDPSSLDLVERNAAAIAEWVNQHQPIGIAVPALGCGLGGLTWTDVYGILLHHLDRPWTTWVWLFPPKTERNL